MSFVFVADVDEKPNSDADDLPDGDVDGTAILTNSVDGTDHDSTPERGLVTGLVVLVDAPFCGLFALTPWARVDGWSTGGPIRLVVRLVERNTGRRQRGLTSDLQTTHRPPFDEHRLSVRRCQSDLVAYHEISTVGFQLSFQPIQSTVVSCSYPSGWGAVGYMKRRRFIVGTATAAIGGSALLGSGAFSRVESHREVTIEVVGDEDAYLRLTFDNRGVDTLEDEEQSFECEGELEITVTNQTKDRIDDIELIPIFENTEVENVSTKVPDESELEVGESKEIIVEFNCVPGVKSTGTFGFDITVEDKKGETIIEAHREDVIEIDCECPFDTDISWVAFCRDDGKVEADITGIDQNTVTWESPKQIDEVVLFGGNKFALSDFDEGKKSGTEEFDQTENTQAQGPPTVKFEDDEDGRCPPSPCDGVPGWKINIDDFGWDEGDDTKEDGCADIDYED